MGKQKSAALEYSDDDISPSKVNRASTDAGKTNGIASN